ncbi:MAG TPA: type II secretion system F family protein [Isosphaeraceae bacterium]|jgi:general secretion pathway protein F|nr:type II secretion system F family protein [Isosphaeraceae bacterium]
MNGEQAGAVLGGRLALRDLIALNDEIAALVRAGVPLDRGLRALDAGGGLGAIAATLGDRLARGETLPEALEAERARIPTLYRAVVEAGLRAGRLPVALEGLATFARGVAELRWEIGQALVYPLMVLVLAYGLFVGLVLEVVPRLLAAAEGFRLPVRGALWLLERLEQSAALWVPVVPAGFVALGVAWAWTGRSAGLGPGRAGALLAWVPWARAAMADARAAGFAELLALLIDHRVPLDRAVTLAADATGDRRLVAAGRSVAEATRRGMSAGSSTRGAEGFPPLLRWMLVACQARGDFAASLRHAAATYRRRALRRADWIREALPTLLLLVIGAGATALYTLALFVPLSILLQNLGN